jgi:hypothetical protein
MGSVGSGGSIQGHGLRRGMGGGTPAHAKGQIPHAKRAPRVAPAKRPPTSLRQALANHTAQSVIDRHNNMRRKNTFMGRMFAVAFRDIPSKQRRR